MRLRPGADPAVAAADELEQAILREGPDTVAMFLAEPVQGAGGVIVPPDGYFQRIREICDQYEVLLVSDEVITGFGRTGRMFGLEHWGIEPDMIQFAKAVTSGYFPLGGIGVNERIAQVMDDGKATWMHALHLQRPSRRLRRGAGKPGHHRGRGLPLPGSREGALSAGRTPVGSGRPPPRG